MELLDGAGSVVAPGDPHALAAAIISLIDSGSEERQRLGLVGRERIERDFSLPSVARRYEKLYEEVALNKRRDRP